MLDNDVKQLDELFKKFQTSRDEIVKFDMTDKSDHWKHIHQLYNMISFCNDYNDLLLKMIGLQRQSIAEIGAKLWRLENKRG